MPELPEVETVCRGLRPALEGTCLKHVELRRPDLRFPFPADFRERLEGAHILSVERRAKYILIRLEGGWIWLIHLGMSGRLTVTLPAFVTAQEGAPRRTTSGQAGHNSGDYQSWTLTEKHDHVLVETKDGARLVYNDTRRFGYMDLIPPGGEASSPHLSSLGPEPLGNEFTPDTLSRALQGKRTPIKTALLDQRVVAGLGNIYVCEALWRAGISPKRLAQTIPGKRAERLVPAIKDVLETAIAAGGSSLRDYVQTNGELGYFQHAWDAYNRAGELCRKPDCGGTIERIIQSGRSSFYCSRHQR